MALKLFECLLIACAAIAQNKRHQVFFSFQVYFFVLYNDPGVYAAFGDTCSYPAPSYLDSRSRFFLAARSATRKLVSPHLYSLQISEPAPPQLQTHQRHHQRTSTSKTLGSRYRAKAVAMG